MAELLSRFVDKAETLIGQSRKRVAARINGSTQKMIKSW